MWRTRKCALGRSWLRMCRADSKVGWREREDMAGVMLGKRGLGGGRVSEVCVRRWVEISL